MASNVKRRRSRSDAEPERGSSNGEDARRRDVDCTVVLLMGVAGVGKTEVGRRLAAELGFVFLDADELHSEKSRERMGAGIPLTDVYRLPWLRRVRRRVDEHHSRGESVVLACSALRERYRRLLLDGLAPARWSVVHLHGEPTLVAGRLSARKGHFFPASLLESQLATLEVPTDAVTVDVAPSVEAVVERVREELRLRGSARR